MALKNINLTVLKGAKSAVLLAVAAAFAMTAIIPVLLTQSTSAAQMTNRSATIDTSVTSATDVEFRFDYDLIDTSNTKAGIIYEFCDNPLGACTLPTGMDVQTSNTHDSQGDDDTWPDNATAFTASTEAADVGDCTNNTNAYMICYERDEGVATGTTGGAVDHTISGITAPSGVQSVYVRISVYSDDDFETADLLDTGTVAVAFVDQLTINGRVQERLDFCVAAIDDTDSLPANVAACTALSDTNVDLGIIDESSIARSPVDTTAVNGADDDYGILMLNTNATNGANISWFAVDDTGGTNQTRSFRVDNATCSVTATDEDDQCFESASGAGSGTTFAVGTENFGMHVRCIDTSLGVTSALGSVPDYYDNADDDTANAVNCEDTDAGNDYGWNDSATAATLTTSSGVVDDEVVKLGHGAAAATTTPSGEYTVTQTFIATVTF